MARVRVCNSNSTVKLLNHAKNRTTRHMLSNNSLCQCAAVQYVLLFLFGSIILTLCALDVWNEADVYVMVVSSIDPTV